MNIHTAVNTEALNCLQSGLNPHWQRTYQRFFQTTVQAFQQWQRARPGQRQAPSGEQLTTALAEFLLHRIQQELERFETLASGQQRFAGYYANAVAEQDRQQLILRRASELGASRAQLRGDRKAFARWFGYDALVDRYRRQVAELEWGIATYLDRLGVIFAQVLAAQSTAQACLQHWRRFALEELILTVLAHPGDTRVRLAGFRCLATVLWALPATARETSVQASTLRYIYRSALDDSQQTWIQCEALSLLAALSVSTLDQALSQRLHTPRAGDDLFVRRHALSLLGERLVAAPMLAETLELSLADPSPAVRQTLAATVVQAPASVALPSLRRLALDDAIASVRAAAIEAAGQLSVTQPSARAALSALLQHVLAGETDPWVLRIALTTLVTTQQALLAAQTDPSPAWSRQFLPVLAQLHRQSDSLAVRRWSAQTHERLWCLADPALQALSAALAQALAAIVAGRGKRLPKRLGRGLDEATLGRLLSVLVQADHPLDVTFRFGAVHIRRGYRFGFRWWRFWYELRKPASDKRQGFNHVMGRLFMGPVHIPSGILAELAETRVPGEPLYIDEEAGARPYLPLLDEMIAALDPLFPTRPMRIYSSEGVTEVKVPAWLVRRVWVRLVLTCCYARYARLRNWQPGQRMPPAAYVQALRRLGFRIRFQAYTSAEPSWSVDPAVQRFFEPVPAAV